MKKDKIILMVMLIIPIIFVAMISVWHAFGVNGVQPWRAIYFLSNHLLVVYLSVIVYYTVGIVELQKIMKYLIIPYFSAKIIYQLLIWGGVNIGGGKLWEFIWGMVFVLVLTIGAIILWKSLRGTK